MLLFGERDAVHDIPTSIGSAGVRGSNRGWAKGRSFRNLVHRDKESS